MTDVTKVKEVVKESLLGSEQQTDVQLSAQSKATFDKNARKDEESGELFMGEEEFINAIAPASEDFVSYILLPLFCRVSGAID
jgi:solute carrier family 25 aspartate/glutamate transporter 12/13